jgi:ribosomal protein S18 acetylase RimI-like enzyme
MRRATLADRAAVVRTLARAFDADPVAAWVLRQDAGRARAYESAFDICFRKLTLPAGETWIAGEDARGVALWTPPGKWRTAPAIPHLPRLAWCVGLGRALELLRSVTNVQTFHPPAPHWYLFALGVAPEHQGQGVGGALLREVLAKADARHEPAYLEASTRDNARLYARHGFAEVSEIQLGKGAPPIWAMWREAR